MKRSRRERSHYRAAPLLGSLLAVSAVATACTAGPNGAAISSSTARSAPSTTGAPSATASSTTSAPSSTSPTTTARTSTPPPANLNPAGLSDAQLVGQLFVTYVYGDSATSATPDQRQANLALYGAATGAEIVRRWHLGGIILIDHNNLDPLRSELSTGNVDDPAQIAGLTAGLQQAAQSDSGLRLLIGTDQEGGSVQRITNGVSWRPSQLQLAQQDLATLRCGYQSLGQQLRALGVNQDYAPVADVVRADGGVIGDRSFGPDPVLDSRDVAAAASGLQAAGVLATLKHWPGHGSTPVDSHAALPVLTESATQWRAVDRPPFQAAAKVAGSVMVGHLALPALDPSGQPATLSGILVAQQLRQVLGYQGVIITDSLWMAPMQRAGTAAQVALRAIQAGDDMLLESPGLPSAFNAVLSRVRGDKSFRLTVQAAVRHIVAAKATVAAARPASC
jgi:beta-N-acetylhexosaminidase